MRRTETTVDRAGIGNTRSIRSRFAFLLAFALSSLGSQVVAQAPVPVPGPRPGGGTTVVVTPEDPAYVVGNISVERTAADAMQARSAAILEGQRRALRQLVQRLAPQADPSRVQVDDQRLQQMVRGVEFANERTGADRYSAVLTVAFSPDRVRAWLAEAGVALSDQAGLTILVIPVWRNSQGVSPLEDRNVWREAWERNVAQSDASSGLRTVLLRADDTDRRLANAEQVFVGDVVVLARLAERYRTNVVVIATLQGDPAGGSMTVEGLRYDSATGARTSLLRLDGVGAGSLEDAARKQLAALETEWRAIGAVRKDTQGTIDAVVPISDLGQWVRLRQRLQSLPAVKRLVIRSLETERAEIRLEHYGTTEELQRALAVIGADLRPDGTRWILIAR